MKSPEELPPAEMEYVTSLSEAPPELELGEDISDLGAPAVESGVADVTAGAEAPPQFVPEHTSDKAGIEDLYRTRFKSFTSSVRRILAQQGLSPDDAEDIVNLSFTAAHVKIVVRGEPLDPSRGGLGPFVWGIIKLRTIDHMRSCRRAQNRTIALDTSKRGWDEQGLLSLPDPGESPEDSVLEGVKSPQLVNFLARLLVNLSPAQREAVLAEYTRLGGGLTMSPEQNDAHRVALFKARQKIEALVSVLASSAAISQGPTARITAERYVITREEQNFGHPYRLSQEAEEIVAVLRRYIEAM